jgi:hypothetical protein
MKRSLSVVKQVRRIEQLKRMLEALNSRDALVDTEDGFGVSLVCTNRVDDRAQVPQARLLRPSSQNPKAGGAAGAFG